jgi:energy-coupling factor transport system substrate-specific component
MSAGGYLALAGLALLALGLYLYERRPLSAQRIALVATLSAAAVAGRVVIPIPSAKPVSAICTIAGITLGPQAGAAVGAVTALVSNVFLGQGPWTPWQMLTWGLLGASAGLLRPLLRHRAALLAFGLVWGFLYGAILNLWQLAAYGPAVNLRAFLATEARGLPFDVTHAVANVVFLAAAGPALARLLERYARRLEVEIVEPLPSEEAAPA